MHARPGWAGGMCRRTITPGPLPVLVLALVAACGRQEPAPAPVPAPVAVAEAEATMPAAPAAADDAPVTLEDVIEHDPRYLVGVSYAPAARAWPGLARALHDYTEAARAELAQAVAGLERPPEEPYALSLGFRVLLQTPTLVAVAADGSLYTGGAHGQPLVARFVWLPQRGEMLSAGTLLASPQGWQAVAEHAAEQLGATAHTRAADESLEPGERQRLLREALGEIAAGTEPRAENFSQFEPVVDDDGRITALRFVFPPYQVGPYADGVQSADVPASVLVPHLAPEYRELFAH